MKILVISDMESKYLWDHFDINYFKDIDMILSAGDLKASYLTFLVTLCNIPVVYVPGNHDLKYLEEPPEGCINCDGKVKVVNGLRIAGLGGCMKYNKKPYQYSQRQMYCRALGLLFPICFHKGFDILLTHAPAYDLDDSKDLAHRGFKAFRKLMDWFSPLYMVHGHVHLNYGFKIPREIRYHDTTIINAYERYIIEIDDTVIEKRTKKQRMRTGNRDKC